MGLNLGGGFAQGMAQGQSIVIAFNDQYERGQQKRELADIASAKSEESTGFTPAQGLQLEELAKRDTRSTSTKGPTPTLQRTRRETRNPLPCLA
mgnify:CR=1 FL=1